MNHGRQFKRQLIDDCGLLIPEMVGNQYGSVKIISRKTEGKWSWLKVHVQCQRCGHKFMTILNNIKRRPKTKCCPSCNPRKPVLVPHYIYRRVQSQKNRCTNPNNSHWHCYGGRGIKFAFKDVNEAATWVFENLGEPPDRSYHLDRINNDGHYEKGNLRWATPVENMNNQKKQTIRKKFIQFRKDHPEIKYADATLSRLLRVMTEDEIIKRYNTPSLKPKGKYGTFSMQGPFRGSLQTTN